MASLASNPIVLRLLGGFAITIGGKSLGGLSRKAKALLSYLALTQERKETRDRLVGVLWSESDQERARASLRQALYEIREAIGPIIVAEDKTSIALSSSVVVDVFEVIAQIEVGKIDAELLDKCGAIAQLVRDLDNIDPAFDEWVSTTRARYRAHLMVALERSLETAQVHLQRHVAQAILSIDGAHEGAARQLIRSYSDAGDVGAALGAYKALWQKLADEYDIEPSRETQDLIARVKLAQPFTENIPAAASPALGTTHSADPSSSHFSTAPTRDGPSIAVLPFVNMSGDNEQDYFADGVTEEIITALGQVRPLFVIARNSAFAYKGRSVDIRQVGRELGVRYILEGSIRKSAQRVRITGQLAEVERGRQIWSAKFESELNDLFTLQDRVAEAVAIAMEPSIRHAELQRSRETPTDSLQAYDFVLRALPNIMMTTTLTANDDAIHNLGKAIELDGSYAQAHGLLAMAYALRRGQGWDIDESIRKGVLSADAAVRLQSNDPIALAAAAMGLSFLGRRMMEAIECVERAYFLNPYSGRVLLYSAWVNLYADRDEEAARLFRKLLEISPRDVEAGYIHCGLSASLFNLDRCIEGVEMARLAVAEAPLWLSSHRMLVANLVGCGKLEEARSAMSVLRGLSPELRVSNVPSTRQRYLEALRAAGLPE